MQDSSQKVLNFHGMVGEFPRIWNAVASFLVAAAILVCGLGSVIYTAIYSEDAWSVVNVWECSSRVGPVRLKLPSRTGVDNHPTRIGYETYSTGSFIVRCVNDDNEKTYVSFDGNSDGYPDSTNGMSGMNLIDSDGSIFYNLQSATTNRDSSAEWAVERETGTPDPGDYTPPKRYVKKACTSDSSQMCFVEDDRTSIPKVSDSDETLGGVYWRLLSVAKDATGNHRSTASLPDLEMIGPAGNREIPVTQNQGKFIQGKYKDNLDDSDNFLATVAVLEVLNNPNGLTDFVLEIDGVNVRATNQNFERWNVPDVVLVHPGEPVTSVAIRVMNGATITGGRLATNRNSHGNSGIWVRHTAAEDMGPVTVDISGGSTVEAWAMIREGDYPRGIRIDMDAANRNVATVRLRDTSILKIRNTSGHTGATGAVEPTGTGINDDEIQTTGADSSGIQVLYPRGLGSIRVGTPLKIRTGGDRSHGIEALLAATVDPLQTELQRLSAPSSYGDIDFGDAVWWLYAWGNTKSNRLWGSTTFSASAGLQLEHLERFFRHGISTGTTPITYADGTTVTVAQIPGPSEIAPTTDRRFYDRLTTAGETPFAAPGDADAASKWPMVRMQSARPHWYANRIAIADAIKAIRESADGVARWNAWRQVQSFGDSVASFIRHRGYQQGAGLVYAISPRAKVLTGSDRAPGLVAVVDVSGQSSEDIHTFIRIDNGGTFRGSGMQGETRFVINREVVTTGAGSHGVLVIATSSTLSETTDTSHPLYGKELRATASRNIHIDVHSSIKVDDADSWGIALMGAEGTTSMVTVASGATVGQQNSAGGGMLFWKAADTVTNFGTIKGKTDFHAGDDRLVLRGGGTVTGVTAGATPDMLDFGAGEDRLEIKSGTVEIGILNLETLVKSGAGDATVGAVAFTTDGTANTMEVRDGRLIVKGHVNVGSGTVTVKNGADLVIEATGSQADNTKLGKITAASINFEGKSSDDMLVSILTTAGTTAAADLTYAKSNWLVGDTKVLVSGRDITADLGDSNYEPLTSPIVTKTLLTVGRDERIDVPINYEDDAGVQEVKVQGVATRDISLGADDDTVDLDGGSISGDVDMGSGDGDTITLRSGWLRGSVTNVDTMVKVGSGTATVGRVDFSSSTLMIRNGRLFIEGHVNLGTDSDDVVTVSAGGQIVIVADGASAGEPYGRITANTIKFEGASPGIQILASIAPSREADVATAKANWRNASASLRGADGSVITFGDSNYRILNSDPRITGGGGGGAASSDSNAFYAAGALAVLWLVLRDDFCCELVNYESGSAGATFAGVKGAGQYRSGGVQTWAKMYSDSEVFAMQGLAVGMDARIGEYGYFGVSAMPSATGSADTTGLSLNRRTSFEGGRYEGRGGWQKDSLFAGVRLSYGDYRASTSFKNVFEASGQMSGSFDLVHTHLELGAGMWLNAGEQATVMPSLGVYGGSLSQGGSSASNAVLVADVPGYRQTYQGWRAGVQLKASDWLSWSDEIKARPQVGLSMYRTRTSGPGKLAMNQRDRLGVLNFKNALPVRRLPQNINAFKAGVSLKKQGSLNMNLNYVGYEADGKFYHGVLARMQVKF